MRIALPPVLIALSLFTGLATRAHAHDSSSCNLPNDATLLSISTEGESKRTPDTANLSASVFTKDPSSNTAMSQNAERMSRVMAGIKAAGIPNKDVQTSSISLYPQYVYQEKLGQKLTGYQASNTINIKVRDLTKLGKIIDILTTNGVSQLNGPSFEIDQIESAYDEARLSALQKAQAQAKSYADRLGLKVRRVIDISESRGGDSRPMKVMFTRAMKDNTETPISLGENSIGVSLNIKFELGK
ncbi:SIMPL domain-containing protein [Xylella fastidiosa]|uniref:SIMPL domain-containing protein n=1 Tax=Xylella fastidiosa subsp. multiplex TaxID=644357 RepID=A0A9Q4QTK7_XYLFS|nr:SIMPL domain-containing protein [Xylella fastidiosa]ERI60888.1 membrane protein [Xylella fastidiosa subsp. multiplex Griffin-1]ACA11478.1 outer membrane protein [Xylella fastidiosa M12]KAJ4852368.1 SIMPL domain-containing protein [Xylella fastidiosa subsp. multiplex]KFA41919.1 outer membrane protein [Xylella fastidiosa]MBE0268413.1 SIMPL domain-containing protein [Xylella fastidiosa subsp. multiplex]